MSDEPKPFQASDFYHQDRVDLPASPGSVYTDSVTVSELPNYVRLRLIDGLNRGELSKHVDTYVGSLAGWDVVDKNTIGALKDLARKVTENARDYDHNKAILEKIVGVLNGLKPSPRTAENG